jgi:hypothetical protein
MATTPAPQLKQDDFSQRINDFRLRIEDLSWLAPNWLNESEATTGSYELKWWDWMSQIRTFCNSQDAGELSTVETQSLQALLESLKLYLPQIQQLDLPVPDSLLLLIERDMPKSCV